MNNALYLFRAGTALLQGSSSVPAVPAPAPVVVAAAAVCSRLDGLCISRILGGVSVAGACFYKLPIIIKIFHARNGAGLNPLALYMETSAYLTLVLYNWQQSHAFTTYGNYFASSLQNIVIIGLVWLWGVGPQDPRPITPRHVQRVLAIAALLVAALALHRHSLAHVLCPYAYAVLAASRVPQLWRNYRTQVVGVQSVLTLGNAVLGSCSNAFIHWRETKDWGMLAGSLLLLGLNAALALQVLMLRSRPPQAAAAAAAGKGEGEGSRRGRGGVAAAASADAAAAAAAASASPSRNRSSKPSKAQNKGQAKSESESREESKSKSRSRSRSKNKSNPR